MTLNNAAERFGETTMNTTSAQPLYYTVEIDNNLLGNEVEVSLTVFYGDPDIFVYKPPAGNCQASPWQHQPNRWESDYAADSTGHRDIITIPKAELVAGKCTYGIMVDSFTRDSRFAFYVSDTGADLVLIQDIPVRAYVARGEYDYFKYTIPAAHKGDELFISVTPISGDPDLLVARGDHPTVGTAEWSSYSYGGDLVTVPATYHSNQTYYIGVYGFSASTFSIAVNLKGTIMLADGIPQHGMVAKTGEARFRLFTDGSEKDITFTVAPESGVVSIYVNPNEPAPERNSHVWSSNSVDQFSAQTLTIRNTDPHFLHTAGYYSVLVYGEWASNFTIVGGHATTVLQLTDGVPMIEDADAGQYEYFMVRVENSSHPVVIDLTPFNGEPDLYVACSVNATGDDSGTPSRVNYAFKKDTDARDTLTIDPSDDKYCFPDSATGRSFFIAVYARETTTFSITASVDPEAEVVLSPGVPQQGLVNEHEYRRYRIYIPDEINEAITLSLTPNYGDPDLYASLSHSERQQDPNEPNRHWNHHDYASLSSRGEDVIVIHPHNNGGAYCTDCWVHIAVYGYHTAAFTLTASMYEDIVPLQDGRPITEHVERGVSEHFSFFVPTNGTTLTITVTPIMGDPDLYVSRIHQYAGPGKSEWAALYWGEDAVVIPNAIAGRYFIGVRAFTNATFTLQAHVSASGSDPSALQDLVPGLPQSGTVERLNFQYYVLALGTNTPASVTISVAPTAGDVGLYINKCAGEGECSSHAPTAQNKHYADFRSDSHAALSRESITIQSTDARACHGSGADCRYVVGVYGFEDASFVLTASSSQDIVTLQDNTPYSDSVTQGGYNHYHFSLVTAHEDITVLITPVTGDPDVFISRCQPEYVGQTMNCTTRPTARSHDWAHYAYGRDVITIPYSESGCHVEGGAPCEFYIGIYGYTNSTYTVLVALKDDHPIRLVDGRPQTGYVLASQWSYYELGLVGTDEDVEVTLTSRDGDADLFVLLTNETTVSATSNPTTHHYDYVSLRYTGNDRVLIHRSDPAYQRACGHLTADTGRCLVRVGVRGWQDSQFVIVATAANMDSTLLDGVPVRETVTHGRAEFFRFPVDQPDRTVTFSLTPLSGHVELLVGWAPRPNMTNAVRSTYLLWSGETVTIHPDDSASCGTCVYYLTVLNPEVWWSNSTATFTLSASIAGDDVIRWLVPGVPVTGTVEPEVFDYYEFMPNAQERDIVFTASAASGSVDLFVSRSSFWAQQPVVPTFHCQSGGTSSSCYQYAVQNATWDSLGSYGRDTVRISGSELSAGEFLVVGVLGVPWMWPRLGANYTLVATTSAGTTLLREGVPIRGSVARGEYTDYRFEVTAYRKVVRVQVTALSGDPDLYVGYQPNPRRGAANFTSTYASGDAVSVFSGHFPDCYVNPWSGATCTLFISVYGYSDAEFTVLVQQTDQAMLYSGVDTQGHVNSTEWQYYTFWAFNGDDQETVITLSPDYGDPDLYVSLDGQEPTLNHYSYVSVRSYSSDTISLRCSYCEVLVGVYGFRESSYLISYATGAAVTQLLGGHSTTGSVEAGRYRYYSLYVPPSAGNLTIIVVPFAGEVYLYGSRQSGTQQVRPTASDAELASVSAGSDSISLGAGDALFTSGTTYVFGVFGASSGSLGTQSQFTILGCTGQCVSTLRDGFTTYGTVSTGESVYYRFFVEPSASRVDFQVTPSRGDPQLFVTTCYEGDGSSLPASCGGQATGLPGPHNYQWRSGSDTSVGGRTVTVPGGDHPFVPGVWYTIAVYGNVGGGFHVSATSSRSYPTLLPGVPSDYNSVAQGATKVFLLQLTTVMRDLSLSVNVNQGDAVVLLSPKRSRDDAPPSCTGGSGSTPLACTNAVWPANPAGKGHSTLVVKFSDPCDNARPGCNRTTDWREGSYFVAVYGVQATDFTLTANLGGEFVHMVPGQDVGSEITEQSVCTRVNATSHACSQERTVHASFFDFKLGSDSFRSGQTMTITVRRSCASDAPASCATAPLSMYVKSLSNAAAQATTLLYPTPDNKDAQLNIGTEDKKSLTISADSTLNLCQPTSVDPDSSGGCHYYVGVYAESTEPVQVQVSYSTSSDVVVLAQEDTKDRVAVISDRVLAGTAGKQLEVYAGASHTNLLLTLESCSGELELGACNDAQCSQLQHLFVSPSRPVEFTTLNVNGVFRVSLNATSDKADFRALVSTGSNIKRIQAPSASRPITAQAPTSSDIKLSWVEPQWMAPGSARPQPLGPDDDVRYVIRIFPTASIPDTAIPNSACGVEQLANTIAVASTQQVPNALQATVGSLTEGTDYTVTLVAEIMRDGSVQQSAAYPTSTFHTVSDTSNATKMGIIIACVVLGLIVLLGVPMYVLWRRNRRLERQLQYEMEDVRNVATVTTSASMAGPEDDRRIETSQGLLAESSDSLAKRISEYRQL
eukprot:CAMPEP_0196770370 /NCGR_PEP_ID=MMETSP1104-20130614/1097_1 /TAXON_ID=33652 /ORGANISM="Cafeteria sp., Strain Caron Lab Isolate" /LENGTH=2418 /DNA_ID=CAMNT_0042140481 /DNA_START=96 /DNA_END=7352 /DNA_ORIENTATION=+